ncbi:hypothetical protein Csa_019099 [Cucumis sativus]|nr:hypothetical protein Csa_019099 [Cucumis sativus]
MANNSCLIIISLIGVLSFTIISNVASSNDVVSTICLKTSNPQFCSSVLKSAGTTDLKGLVVYTLNLAHTNAEKSLTLANSLAKTATNPQLKQQYSSCAESYDEAIGDIENAQKDLALGDFNGVNIELWCKIMNMLQSYKFHNFNLTNQNLMTRGKAGTTANNPIEWRGFATCGRTKKELDAQKVGSGVFSSVHGSELKPDCADVKGTTDLKGLAVYTLNLAHSNAGKSLILANSLAKATTNPQLKQRYSFCAESYDEVVGDIENAQKRLGTWGLYWCHYCNYWCHDNSW